MIPAIFLVLAAVLYRVATGLYIHDGATWLSNFAPLAAIGPLFRRLPPVAAQIFSSVRRLFVSDLILNSVYSASLLDAHVVCRYLALFIIGSWRSAVAETAFVEDDASGFDRRIGVLLS